MKLICVTILLSLWVSPMVTTPCKTVVRFKQRAMEYACQTQRMSFKRAFGNIGIPDLVQKREGGEGGIFGIGNILGAAQELVGNVINVVGISILDVNLPNVQIKLSPGVVLQVSVETRFHIAAKLLPLTDIELQLAARAFANVKISKTSKECPMLDVTACKSICGDIEIKLGGEGLLSPILKPIEAHLHAILNKQLCLSVSKVLLGLNANLGLLAAFTSITEDLNMQYSLVNQPVVTGDCMDMDMDTKYMVQDQVVEFSTGEEEFSLPPKAGSQTAMVIMGFSRNFFQTFCTAFQSSGGFNCEIPSTHASLGNQLTTSALSSYIPEIRKQYPNPMPLKITIVVVKAPVVTIQDSQLCIRLFPSVDMLVASHNSKWQHLMTIDVGVSFVAALGAQGGKLSVSVSLSGDINLTFSSVSFGPCECNPYALTGFMRKMLEEAYVVHINEALSVGIHLPKLPNLSFTKQKFEMKEKYAVMSCDLEQSQQQDEWK